MKPAKWVWLNGKFVHFSRAKIPIFCGAVQYGFGVFEGIRFFETKDKKRAIFRLKEHLDRLALSAKTLEANLPLSQERLQKAIVETIKKNEVKEGYVRPYLGLTEKKLGVEPNPFQTTIAIAVFDWAAYFSKPLKLKLVSVIRPHPDSLDMEAKISGYYVNSRLAKVEAKTAGFDDALMVDHRGFLAELSVANIFLCWENLAGETTILAPTSKSILSGITRDTIITLLKDKGYEVLEVQISPGFIFSEQSKVALKEIFACGTAAGVVPVVAVSHRPIGNGEAGPVALMLEKLYSKAVRGEIDQYKQWLTYID